MDTVDTESINLYMDLGITHTHHVDERYLLEVTMTFMNGTGHSESIQRAIMIDSKNHNEKANF